MPTKYIHLRQHIYNERGSDVLSKGGATVAFEIIPVEGGIDVRYAFAKCNLSDTFNRKTGRVKSGGRLKSHQYSNLLKMRGAPTLKEIISSLIEHYYKDEGRFNPFVSDFVW